jgi:hypothetical protein
MTTADMTTPAAVEIEHHKLVGACDPWFEPSGSRVPLAKASDRDLAYAMVDGVHLEHVVAEWRRRYPSAPSGAKGWAQAAHATATRFVASVKVTP